jgi:hypothetical protein
MCLLSLLHVLPGSSRSLHGTTSLLAPRPTSMGRQGARYGLSPAVRVQCVDAGVFSRAEWVLVCLCLYGGPGVCASGCAACVFVLACAQACGQVSLPLHFTVFLSLSLWAHTCTGAWAYWMCTRCVHGCMLLSVGE